MIDEAPKKPTPKKRPPRPKATIDQARVDRVVKFGERYLRHMKGRWAGQPFKLEPWQRDEIIAPLFGTVDGKGNRFYREAALFLPRKNGKSTITSLIALYCLLADEDDKYGAEVYSVAGSKAQAGIVFKSAADMVRSSPALRAACKVYRSVIEVPETGSIYRVLSSDWTGGLLQGLNVSCAIVDELANSHRTADVLEAMKTATAARKSPLIVSITTSGPEKDGVGWDTYQRVKAKTDPRLFGYIREAPADCAVDDREAWRQANPASWVTQDFLEDQMRSLPEPVFRRLHLNQWIDLETAKSAIPPDSWHACAGTPIFDPDLPTVIGVDAASRRDTTAVALVQRDLEGRHHVRTWHFTAERQMGYLDYGAVEDLIRELCAAFPVTRIAFDPFQMVRTQQILAAEGIPAETFPQSDQRMVPACAMVYDAIMEGRLVHGSDPILTEQVLNAAIRETARGWRFEKRSSSGPIDGLVALTIGVQLAEWEANLGGGPQVFVF